MIFEKGQKVRVKTIKELVDYCKENSMEYDYDEDSNFFACSEFPSIFTSEMTKFCNKEFKIDSMNENGKIELKDTSEVDDVSLYWFDPEMLVPIATEEKNTSGYKVGDKVRVKTIDQLKELATEATGYPAGDWYLIIGEESFVEDMNAYCGQAFEIEEVLDFDNRVPRYHLKGCHNWNFTEDMFELVDKNIYDDSDDTFCLKIVFSANEMGLYKDTKLIKSMSIDKTISQEDNAINAVKELYKESSYHVDLGDFVVGLPSATIQYGHTIEGWVGKVVGINDDELELLDINKPSCSYTVKKKYFKPVDDQELYTEHFSVGDIIRGEGNFYGISNENWLGIVLEPRNASGLIKCATIKYIGEWSKQTYLGDQVNVMERLFHKASKVEIYNFGGQN